MTQFVVRFEGQSWPWDDEGWTLADYREVKSKTGWLPDEFYQNLRRKDPDAIAALVWRLRVNSGEQVKFSDVTGRLTTFELEMADEPDPTDGVETP